VYVLYCYVSKKFNVCRGQRMYVHLYASGMYELIAMYNIQFEYNKCRGVGVSEIIIWEF
jgi:hypothetical protein